MLVSREARVGPLAEPDDSATGGDVAKLLFSHCPADGLVTLLSCHANEIMASAIVTLGAKGSMCHCGALVGLLRHESPAVVELAENSLWQIWMRAGTTWGNEQLAHTVEHIRENRLAEALSVLDGLVFAEPTFAEAYDQRGIVLSLLERLEEAGAAFRQALQYNRHHFAAAVSLGHVYAQQGQFRTALLHYRHGLELHPGLASVAEIVERFEAIAQ